MMCGFSHPFSLPLPLRTTFVFASLSLGFGDPEAVARKERQNWSYGHGTLALDKAKTYLDKNIKTRSCWKRRTALWMGLLGAESTEDETVLETSCSSMEDTDNHFNKDNFF